MNISVTISSILLFFALITLCIGIYSNDLERTVTGFVMSTVSGAMLILSVVIQRNTQKKK